MMRKKTNYTQVTPIPSTIPRQLAVEMLHSHGEIITLNPLVLDYKPVKAPRDAPADEYYSTWYEIQQKIQFVPGAGKMGSGKIHFKGCFHDMDYGIQTHMYAPANVDLRNKWRICGSQPGEPREIPEIGIGAPSEGLYLREDVEIKCNFAMASFVKKEMKAAAKIMVDRMVKKAELLDSGVLQAMFENGRLKTVNPADRTSQQQPQSPGFNPQHSSMSSRTSHHPFIPISEQKAPLYAPTMAQHPAYAQQQNYPYPQQQSYAQSQQQSFPMELAGDFYHPSQDIPSHLQPQPAWKRNSTMSELSGASPVTNEGRWSTTGSEYQTSNASSRPTSYATDTSAMRSPRPEQTSFGSELAPMQETNEEHESRRTALRKLEGQQEPTRRPYNPQDYAHT